MEVGPTWRKDRLAYWQVAEQSPWVVGGVGLFNWFRGLGSCLDWERSWGLRELAGPNPRGVRQVIQVPSHIRTGDISFLVPCLISYLCQDKRSHSKIPLIDSQTWVYRVLANDYKGKTIDIKLGKPSTKCPLVHKVGETWSSELTSSSSRESFYYHMNKPRLGYWIIRNKWLHLSWHWTSHHACK